MPATKSGSSIIIDGSPNTLSSVTADINDASWIEESPAGTFTVKNKIIDIQDVAIFTIGDSGDYSVSETLKLIATENNGCAFYIREGGELRQFGDTIIDFADDGHAFWNYLYHYGKSYLRGNATYKPTWLRVEKVAFESRFYKNQAGRNHDVMDWDYAKWITPFSETSWNVGFLWDFYFSYMADPGYWKVKNVEFGQTGEQRRNVFNHYANTKLYVDMSGMTIEDCVFKKIISPILSYGINPYVKNCTFDECEYVVYRNHPLFAEHEAGNTGIGKRIIPHQEFSFYDGCTWMNSINDELSLGLNGKALLRDCDFQRATRNISMVSANTLLYIWTGCTFAGSVGYNGIDMKVEYFSTIYWVHALDLTVEDTGGSPIEGAMIIIKQKNGEDDWAFFTGADGRPTPVMSSLNGKILLKWKELYYDSGYQTKLLSDPGNSTYHEIWIWKEGYEPVKLTYEMTADRTATVQLEDALTVPDVRDTVPFGLGLAGELDLPVVGAVEKGVVYDSTTKVGTFKPPAEADVRIGEGYGEDDVEFTGQLDLPLEGDVEKGIQYDATTKTGTFKVPLENIVKKDEQYGKDDVEFTGTLITGAIITGPNIEGRLQKNANIVGILRSD